MDLEEITAREQEEYERLSKLYERIPRNKRALVDGLIRQAARLRARLDSLWLDLTYNGETELFTQSEKTEPYERERPQSRTFTASDKSYQGIMKQLDAMLPAEDDNDALASFLEDSNE